MELNNTLLQDIILSGELTKKPAICFEKIAVKKEHYSVREKGEILKRKVNDIYDNFEIWDGNNLIKPILPKPKTKDKSEKNRKKNYILDNINKLKMPLFSLICKSSKTLMDSLDKVDSSNQNTLPNFKTRSKTGKAPLINLKSIGNKMKKTLLFSLESKKNHKQTSMSMTKNSTSIETSNRFLTNKNKHQISKFFITDSAIEKSSLKTTDKNNNSNLNNNETTYNPEEKKLVMGFSLNKTHKVNSTILGGNSKNVKFTTESTRKSIVTKEKVRHSILKNVYLQANDINNLDKIDSFSPKNNDSICIIDKEINSTNEIENILSTNCVATTTDGVNKNKTHNYFFHKQTLSDMSYNIRTLTTPPKAFSNTDTNFNSKSTKSKSCLNKKSIYSNCDVLSEENNIINHEIRVDNHNFDYKKNLIKEDYSKMEKEQLKDDIPQKSLVGQITIKGQKRYISAQKANILRLSDSVSKMGSHNVFKFFNAINEKYESYAKVSGITNPGLERQKSVFKIKENNLDFNKRKMRNILDNIHTIQNKHNKSLEKKYNKK